MCAQGDLLTVLVLVSGRRTGPAFLYVADYDVKPRMIKLAGDMMDKLNRVYRNLLFLCLTQSRLPSNNNCWRHHPPVLPTAEVTLFCAHMYSVEMDTVKSTESGTPLAMSGNLDPGSSTVSWLEAHQLRCGQHLRPGASCDQLTGMRLAASLLYLLCASAAGPCLRAAKLAMDDWSHSHSPNRHAEAHQGHLC